MTSKIRFLLVALLLTPAAVFAAKAEGPKAKAMAKYDLNHDGKLDDAEIAAIQKDFAAELQVVRHLIQRHAAEEPGIFARRSRIDPDPAAAVGCPFADGLLGPNRQEGSNHAVAQSKLLVSGRDFEERVDGDHRGQAMLILLDEPVFHADLGIAESEMGARRRPDIAQLRLDMQLNIRKHTVVGVDQRQGRSPIGANLRG